MNNYISKYAEFQTHFHRTDPFKHVPFSEESKPNKFLGALGFVVFVIGLMVMS